MKRLMFYCQYVFGVGHLVRSLEIVRALARDFEVTFVIGGEPVTGLRFPAKVKLVQLPPLEAPLGFEGLRSCDPAVTLEQIREVRRQRLLDLLENVRPQVLVVELFPFGRKQFSFELLPLVERARQLNSLVVCSLRDILVRKTNQDEHERRACDIANAHFDLILVHGDPELVTIGETFSRAGDLRPEIRYTGYVVKGGAASRANASGRRPAIVASIGGGRSAQGQQLLEALIGAAALLQDRLPHQFRIFAGPLMPDDVYARLRGFATGARNVTLCRFTPDLIGQLAAAELSVSLGGYNTTMDVLRSGVRALLLPAADSGDREQELRAAKLERLGVIQTIRQDQATPWALAEQIMRAPETAPRRIALDFNGAENSRSFVHELLLRRDLPGRDRQGAVLKA